MNNHQFYGEHRFKSNHYIFSVFLRTDTEWWMYARHEENGGVYYLGKIKDSKREMPLNQCRWDYSIIRDSDRLYYQVFQDYLRYNRLEKIVEEMDKRSYLCKDRPMPVKEKKDRNRRIVELVEKGKSYADVALILGLAKSTVGNVYKRDKAKYSLKPTMKNGKKLSPVVIKRGLAPSVDSATITK